MKKILFFLIIFIPFSLALNAQLSYSFSALTGTYTPLAGATVPLLISPDPSYSLVDEGYANAIPIGFIFMYNGIAYNNININANGFITLGDGFVQNLNEDYSTPNLSSGPVSYPTARPLIAPLWSDLYLPDPDSISYLLSGTAPNRILTVEWSSVLWDFSAEGAVISFQVKLYETSNVIDFIYRQGPAIPTATASIGLSAIQTGLGNFISLTNSSSAPDTSSTIESEVDAPPATNQVYRFTPLGCIVPNETIITNVTTTSLTFSWNAVQGATGYEYATSTSTIPPASGTFVSTNTTNISGLTAGVNNYLFVRTACVGGVFSAWAVKPFITCTANILPLNGTTVSRPPTVSWNAVEGVTGYTIMLSSNGTDFTNLMTVGDSITSTQIFDLQHDSTYYFYVRPVLGIDTALAICESNATSFTIEGIPVIPCTTNTFPANGATSDLPVQASFKPVAGATAYEVMFSTDGITYQDLGPFPDTFALLPPLGFNKTYHFYVRPIIGEDTATTACVSNSTSFITIAQPSIPVNDSCGAAINIIAGDSSINGSTFSATPSAKGEICPETGTGAPSDPDDDVWYKFTAPASGSATVTVAGAPYFDAILSVFSGDCDDPVLLNCSDSTLDEGTEKLDLNNLLPGKLYYVRVYDYYTARPGKFRISVAGGVLPVTLGELQGKRLGYENKLAWNTQTELNNQGFEVQRSADGINFVSLDFVTSKAPGGNSSILLNYSYSDINPLPGSSFYRIRQYDKNGRFSFTNVALVKTPDITRLQLFTLYPNPSKASLNLVIGSPSNKQIRLLISDMAGKIVSLQGIGLKTGYNNLKVNIGKLAAGTYLIKATCGDGCRTAVKRFVKQ